MDPSRWTHVNAPKDICFIYYSKLLPIVFHSESIRLGCCQATHCLFQIEVNEIKIFAKIDKHFVSVAVRLLCLLKRKQQEIL